MKMSNLEDILKSLTFFQQSHLLKFVEELEEFEQTKFLEEILKIDFNEMNCLFQKAMSSIPANVKKLNSIEPIPLSKFESEEHSSDDQLNLYYKCGLEEISISRVGVLLMAGGQGTRLGVNYPKGLYSIGLISNKSLFQLQAERIRCVQQLAYKETNRSGKITWYIMTSESTMEETKIYLSEHQYFGLDPNNIVIFKQGCFPCFSFDGKILLEDKNKIFSAPDGNGGVYRALQECEILNDMQQRGIKYIHAHSVDNVLIKVADPTFIGYCVMKQADCGVKVVRKEYPTESVGVVCQINGQFQVVEYSEITDDMAYLKDSDGNLVYNAGNICNHYFTTKFLQIIVDEYESELKLHVAKKIIPYIDEHGTKVKPTLPNGIKIEKFVFDVFPFSNNFVTWQVPRYSEFSSLKNSDDIGVDCPSTARKAIFSLHKKYIEKFGGTVIGDEVEISPLLSYAGENLEFVRGKVFKSPIYLFSDKENIIAAGISNLKDT